MKRKINAFEAIVALTIILIVLAFFGALASVTTVTTGDDLATDSERQMFVRIRTQGPDLYVDCETGVHYLRVSGHVSPRYSADGSLFVDISPCGDQQ